MARRDDDEYQEKRNRSWSEIDKRRDGGRTSGSTPAARERLEKGAQYSRYKSAADKFFSGELMPESLAEKLDPTGEGKARREALKKLNDCEDFKAFAQQAKAYVDAWGMPEDPYLLDRLLGHPDDALVLRTLAEMNRLLDEGTFKAPKSLPQRLKSIELGSDDDEVQDAAKALAARLRG